MSGILLSFHLQFHWHIHYEYLNCELIPYLDLIILYCFSTLQPITLEILHRQETQTSGLLWTTQLSMLLSIQASWLLLLRCLVSDWAPIFWFREGQALTVLHHAMPDRPLRLPGTDMDQWWAQWRHMVHTSYMPVFSDSEIPRIFSRSRSRMLTFALGLSKPCIIWTIDSFNLKSQHNNDRSKVKGLAHIFQYYYMSYWKVRVRRSPRDWAVSKILKGQLHNFYAWRAFLIKKLKE